MAAGEVAPAPAAGPVVRIVLEYDGSGFWGWAAQPGRRTVQQTVEDALRTVLRRPGLGVVAAGRTDRGVHARGQVVSYPGPLPHLRSLNAVLPVDVKAVSAEEMAPGFDARRSALSRSYRYVVLARRAGPSPFWNGRALWWPHRVDLDALQSCAAALVGRHDLTAFTPSQSYHHLFERDVLAAEWRRSGERLEFLIEAPAFMRAMNRILVGTMLEVAGGRRTPEDFVALLDGAPRSAAGPTAPPHGLYLESVRY